MSTDSPDPGDDSSTCAPTIRSTSSCGETADFAELRSKFRRFVFPATFAFMVWYLLYVVMSNWAHDFMSTKVVGNINIALVFGILQFVSTFCIAYLYGRYMEKNVDPLARKLNQRYEDEHAGHTGGVA